MAKTSSKKIKRKCSLCQQTGHTKNKCTSQSLPATSVPQDQPKKSGAHPVFVRVSSNPHTSPHVVNLKRKDDVSVPMPVFKEAKSLPVERVAVDLSHMVRQANNKVQQQKKFSPSFLHPTIQADVPVIESIAPLFTPPEEKLENEEEVIIEQVQETLQIETTEESTKKSSTFLFQFNWSSVAMKSLALLLLCVLPLPAVGYYRQVQSTTDKVVGETTTAFLSLQASTVAALQANISQAQSDLNQALHAFSNAQAVLEKEHTILQYVAGLLPVVGKEVQSRQHILQAGHHLALGNTYLVQGVQKASEEKNANLIEKIEVIRQHLHSSLPQYKEALLFLNKVSTQTVPAEYQSSFDEFRVLFAAFINDMEDLVSLSETVKIVFGGEEFRRYLVIFQNNHELRATGGFPGSFAVIDVQKGKLLNIEVPGGGPYDLKGQLGVYAKPPAPLLLTNNRFEFQDANWWPHFPSSAQKLASFYEQARGSTVDGVIAINASVLEKILSVLGPVENTDHNVVLSSQNALATLQRKVEKEYDKEKNTPKAIIGDVLKDLMGKLSTVEAHKSLQLLSALHGSLQDKEIQVYMKEQKVQETFQKFGWTGEIASLPSYHDYLMVVQSNLQGQKSDAKMNQTIEHQAVVQDDGSIIDTVIIRRKHNGEKGEEFYGAANISYLRVYVPEGAELIDAGGFDYPPEEAFKVPQKWYTEDQEVAMLEDEVGVHAKTGTRIFKGFNKTVFGNWMITMPGEVSESYLVYKLPFSAVTKEKQVKTFTEKILQKNEKETSTYHLFTQSQSGIKSDFVSSIIYGTEWTPAWVSNEEEVTLATNGAELRTTLSNQESLAVIMEREKNKE